MSFTTTFALAAFECSLSNLRETVYQGTRVFVKNHGRRSSSNCSRLSKYPFSKITFRKNKSVIRMLCKLPPTLESEDKKRKKKWKPSWFRNYWYVNCRYCRDPCENTCAWSVGAFPLLHVAVALGRRGSLGPAQRCRE